MKLFAEKAGSNLVGLSQPAQKKQTQQILVISESPQVGKEVSSYLSMNNMNDHQVTIVNFFTLQDNGIIGSASSVIVDIANETDVELISKRTTLLIPNIVRVIFIGNNDSISFSQNMKRAGLNYLHRQYELHNIAAILLNVNSSSSAANLMKISILGCKGGIGTSTIAYSLFQSLTKLSSIPTLMVQGNSGSSDLDLIMEQVLPRDGSIYYVNDHAAVRLETNESSWNYTDASFNRFNLILFEHSLVGSINEHFETIFSNSQTIILVLNRNLTCLRVAKKVIEEHKRSLIVRPVHGQKLIVCLNENIPSRPDDMKNEDIEQYLQCPLSLIMNYSSKTLKNIEDSPVYKFAQNHILGLSVDKIKFKPLFSFMKLLGK